MVVVVAVFGSVGVRVWVVGDKDEERTEPSFLDVDPAALKCTGVPHCLLLSVSVQVAVMSLSFTGDGALNTVSRSGAVGVRRVAEQLYSSLC